MPNRYGVVDYMQERVIESRAGIAGSPYRVAVVWISGEDNARSVLKYSWNEAAAIAWIKAEGRRWQQRGYFPRGQFAIERTEQLQLAGCDRCKGELHYIHAAITPETPTKPEHDMWIQEDVSPFGMSYKAMCTCGAAFPAYGAAHDAVEARNMHLRDSGVIA